MVTHFYDHCPVALANQPGGITNSSLGLVRLYSDLITICSLDNSSLKSSELSIATI